MSEDDVIIVHGITSELGHRDRMLESLESRSDYVTRMIEARNSQEPFEGYDDPDDAFFEFPLGIDIKRIVLIHLSTGGPADWLEVEVNEEKHYSSVNHVTYHFADWGQHAEVRVYDTDPLFIFAEEVINNIADMPW